MNKPRFSRFIVESRTLGSEWNPEKGFPLSTLAAALTHARILRDLRQPDPRSFTSLEYRVTEQVCEIVSEKVAGGLT